MNPGLRTGTHSLPPALHLRKGTPQVGGLDLAMFGRFEQMIEPARISGGTGRFPHDFQAGSGNGVRIRTDRARRRACRTDPGASRPRADGRTPP